jgi:hypothetical protein
MAKAIVLAAAGYPDPVGHGEGSARTMSAQPDDLDAVWEAFHRSVNMTSRELRDWLHSEPAQSVREILPGDASAQETGHRVAEILAKRKQDLTDDDVRHMRWVIDFVAARLENRPDAATDDEWRHELMIAGHDPLKPS